MFRSFFSTKLSKVIIVFILFGLIVFINPANFFDPVRYSFKLVISPFEKVAYIFATRMRIAGEYLSSIGQIKEENEKLAMENQKLVAQNAQLEGLKRENDILKEQLDLLPRQKFSLESAYVISQDSQGSGSWIEISKGSRSGIAEGSPVIVSQGILIGVVSKVNSDSSMVSLISSPQSAISSLTTSAGAKGIIRGEYGLGIIFDMILPEDELKPGDEIITAGTSGQIPRGLFIGEVANVRLSSDRLFQQAEVSSPVNFFKLDVVSVVKNVSQN